jgi:hypothetical protein
MIRTILTKFHTEKKAAGDVEIISFWKKGRESHAVTSMSVRRFKMEHPSLWVKEASLDYEAWKAPAKPAKAKAAPAAAVPAPAPEVAPKKRGKKAA